MLLIGLALSDLGVGLILQPLYIAFLLSFAKNGAVPLTCVTFVVISIFGPVLTCVSFGTVVTISVERYLALCLHLRYDDVVTVKRVRIFLTSLWLVCGMSPFIWVWFAPRARSYISLPCDFFCGLYQDLPNNSLSRKTNAKNRDNW